ncbi:MAG: HAD family hydrolase, partial [Rhodococcus sp. (in: high G+C Gram-positive bacteria)]
VPSERPTHIGFDLEALNRPPAASRVGPKPGWSVHVEHAVLTVTHDGRSGVDALDGLLAAAHAVWGSPSEATTNWHTISIVGDGVDSLRERLAA